MELRHFRYFVAVAEEENVSRAALRLRLSQPGLSRQMQDLEEEMGVALFARDGRSLHLTDAGKVFLQEARAVLARAEEAVKTARRAVEGPRAEIQTGYAPSLTVHLLPQTLRLFQSMYPRVRVALHDLSSEEMLARVRAGKLDVALMALNAANARRAWRDLESRELARYPMRVAMAAKHRLARAKGLTLAQVAGEPLIGYSRAEYPDYHQGIEEAFSSAGIKARMAEEHDGVTGLIAAVESGAGVALVPSLLACMVGARLRLVPLLGKSPEVVVGAVWKREKKNAFVQAFVAAAASVPPLQIGKGGGGGMNALKEKPERLRE